MLPLARVPVLVRSSQTPYSLRRGIFVCIGEWFLLAFDTKGCGMVVVIDGMEA